MTTKKKSFARINSIYRLKKVLSVYLSVMLIMQHITHFTAMTLIMLQTKSIIPLPLLNFGSVRTFSMHVCFNLFLIICIGDNVTGLPTTKLSKNAAETFLRDALLNKQQRIEIWKQERLDWKIIRKASPGNLQGVEDFLFSSAQLTSAPVVIAVKYGISGENKSVGVAFADTTINQLGVSEFIDNELYSNLEVKLPTTAFQHLI